MAIPSVRAVGAVASGAGATAVNPNAAHQANDVELLYVQTLGSDAEPTLSTPAGFARVIASVAAGTASRLTVFWRRWNGTDGAPTIADSGDHQIGIMVSIQSAYPTGNPWDVAVAGTNAAGTACNVPAGTTSTPNNLVLVGVSAGGPRSNGTAAYSVWANATLSGFVETLDQSRNSGAGGSIGVATGGLAAAGATGATSATGPNWAHSNVLISIKEIPTFTANGRRTLSALTAKGAATRALPTRTANGATTLAPLVVAGAGTFTAPEGFFGDGATLLPPLTATGVASSLRIARISWLQLEVPAAPPTRTATGSLTLPGLTAYGAAVPPRTLTGAVILPALTARAYAGAAVVALAPATLGVVRGATGGAKQPHLLYATNTGRWWLFTYTGVLDSGTATGGTTSSLVDSTQDWTPSALAGNHCVIIAGTGAGYSFEIGDNTDTTLPAKNNGIAATLSFTPDETTEYVLVEALKVRAFVSSSADLATATWSLATGGATAAMMNGTGVDVTGARWDGGGGGEYPTDGRLFSVAYGDIDGVDAVYLLAMTGTHWTKNALRGLITGASTIVWDSPGAANGTTWDDSIAEIESLPTFPQALMPAYSAASGRWHLFYHRNAQLVGGVWPDADPGSGTVYTLNVDWAGTGSLDPAATTAEGRLVELAGGVMMAVYDAGAIYTVGVYGLGVIQQTTLHYVLSTSATAWPAANDTWAVVPDLSTTANSPNDWSVVARTTTDVHLVRRNSALVLEHIRFDGSDWGAVTTLPTDGLTGTVANAGVSLLTDGTAVWCVVLDSDALNTVKVLRWDATNGWATTWQASASNASAKAFLVAAMGASTAAAAWTEGPDGQGRYQVMVAPLALPAGIYTGDGAATLVVLTAQGSATVATVTRTADGAVPLPALTAAGSATYTAPTRTATGAATLGALQARSSAAFAMVVRQAEGAASLAGITATGGATYTAPTRSADGTASLAALTASGAATYTAPTRSATGAALLPALQAAASAFTGTPTRTADGAALLPALTTTAAGTVVAPTFTGQGTVTLGALTATGGATRTPPLQTGAATALLAALTASSAGSTTPPVFTATGAATLGAVQSRGSAVYATRVCLAEGAASLAAVTATGVATYTAPTRTATGQALLPSLTATGAATRTVPPRTGAGATTLPALTARGTAQSTPPSFTARGAAQTPALQATGGATYTYPTRTAAGSASLRRLTATGAALRVAPVYTATAAATLPALGGTARAINLPPGSYLATGTVTLGALVAGGVARYSLTGRWLGTVHAGTTLLGASGAGATPLGDVGGGDTVRDLVGGGVSP